MFLCKPEKNVRQSVMLIVIISLIAAAFALLSVTAPAYRWIYQLLFCVAVTAVVLILTRNTMTQWIYGVEGTSFTILKQLGSKTTKICDLDLEQSLLLIDEASFLAGKEKDKYAGVIHKRLNYCQNINSPCYCYVFVFQEKNYLIKFEPNEVFVKILNDAIASSKKK